MKQRLAIGSALLGNLMLVFDEPTNGLDPVERSEIRELIKIVAGRKDHHHGESLLEWKNIAHVAILKRGNTHYIRSCE